MTSPPPLILGGGATGVLALSEECCGAGRRNTTSRSGGGGGIRTHEALADPPVFKTGAFNRSATPPGKKHQASSIRYQGKRRRDERDYREAGRRDRSMATSINLHETGYGVKVRAGNLEGQS